MNDAGVKRVVQAYARRKWFILPLEMNKKKS